MDPVAAAVLTSWGLHWETVGIIFAAAALYLRGWIRLHREAPHRYTGVRLAAYYAGLVVLLLALESPLDAFGGLLLQAHMIQHLLLLMVAPPLLLLGQPIIPLLRGLPKWIFKDALGPFLAWRELKHAGRAVVHPVVAWCIFASVIIGWHLPRSYELGLESSAWHGLEHACFFWAAILFWWPVIEVWPSAPTWPQWAMIPYLVSADIVNTALSAVLSFSDHVLYPAYQRAPRLWGISALSDQAAAGAIMWVPGSIAFLLPAVILGIRALETHRVFARIARPVRPISIARPQGPRDLLRTPILGSIFRLRHFRRFLQLTMFALAAVLIVEGLFGTQVTPLNPAGVLPWIYWRGFAVIALLIVGNLFCMACPFTLLRDLGRKLVAPRFRWPSALRSKWLAAGMLVTYFWAYEAFSLWDRPRATAWIILGYFMAAFSVDMLFRGASFCKYVCPIGQFHFVHSLVSPSEVTVREPAVCESCRTHDCIRGNGRQRGCELQLFQPKKAGNFDCTFCLDCVQACPQHNVGVLPVLPGQSLRDDARGSGIGRLTRRPDVAALVLILVFGAFLNAAGMTDPVMMWMHRWHAQLGSMIPVVTLLYLIGLIIVPAAVFVSQRGKGMYAFVLALVPLGFSMWLAHLSYHLVVAWTKSSPEWLPGLELLVLGAGLLLTLHTAWDAAHDRNAARRIAGRMWPSALLATGLYAVGVWIVFQPMQMRGMVMR
jgi:cytochrome c oxidase assembly factor CtaG/ferredoxin